MAQWRGREEVCHVSVYLGLDLQTHVKLDTVAQVSVISACLQRGGRQENKAKLCQ